MFFHIPSLFQSSSQAPKASRCSVCAAQQPSSQLRSAEGVLPHHVWETQLANAQKLLGRSAGVCCGWDDTSLDASCTLQIISLTCPCQTSPGIVQWHQGPVFSSDSSPSLGAVHALWVIWQPLQFLLVPLPSSIDHQYIGRQGRCLTMVLHQLPARGGEGRGCGPGRSPGGGLLSLPGEGSWSWLSEALALEKEELARPGTGWQRCQFCLILS